MRRVVYVVLALSCAIYFGQEQLASLWAQVVGPLVKLVLIVVALLFVVGFLRHRYNLRQADRWHTEMEHASRKPQPTQVAQQPPQGFVVMHPGYMQQPTQVASKPKATYQQLPTERYELL
jgi:hypothetical protein